MQKVILYTAVSLDGYIARPDGSLDWLTSVPPSQSGDYGYSELLAGIGTVIMGRKTYDAIIGFDVEWPYAGLDTFIVTSQKNLGIKSPDTYLISENIKELVTELKGQSQKDIWLVGGGQLNAVFINHGLVDRMILTVIPKLIGEGIPLFANKIVETDWKLLKTETYDTGVVNLTYDQTR